MLLLQRETLLTKAKMFLFQCLSVSFDLQCIREEIEVSISVAIA